jgi:hypothetical protein
MKHLSFWKTLNRFLKSTLTFKITKASGSSIDEYVFWLSTVSNKGPTMISYIYFSCNSYSGMFQRKPYQHTVEAYLEANSFHASQELLCPTLYPDNHYYNKILCQLLRNRRYYYLQLILRATVCKTLKLRLLCKIWGFHGGDYEECSLLGCGDVWVYYKLTFRSNVSPPSIQKSQ